MYIYTCQSTESAEYITYLMRYKSTNVTIMFMLCYTRAFEAGQTAPEICVSEMRQIITTALRTVFGEVGILIDILPVFNIFTIYCLLLQLGHRMTVLMENLTAVRKTSRN